MFVCSFVCLLASDFLLFECAIIKSIVTCLPRITHTTTICLCDTLIVGYVFFCNFNQFLSYQSSFILQSLFFFMLKLLIFFSPFEHCQWYVINHKLFIQLTFCCCCWKAKWRENLLNTYIEHLDGFFFNVTINFILLFEFVSFFVFIFSMYVIPSALNDKIRIRFCEKSRRQCIFYENRRLNHKNL